MDEWMNEELERLKREIRIQEDSLRSAQNEIRRLRCVIRQLQEEEMEILNAILQKKLPEDTEYGKTFNEAIEMVKKTICDITQIQKSDIKGE